MTEPGTGPDRFVYVILELASIILVLSYSN